MFKRDEGNCGMNIPFNNLVLEWVSKKEKDTRILKKNFSSQKKMLVFWKLFIWNHEYIEISFM